MIGGMWRWAWTAGVFGLFFVVVGAALDGAPRADGELPLIEPDTVPIKERVALPEIDQIVPRSSVLNLLADGDDTDAATPEALASLEQGIERERARARSSAEAEAAFEDGAARPDGGAGDAASATPDRAGNATDEAPFDAVPTRARRPATAPREPAESPGDLTAPELAASGRDATASQEAAEGPGDLAAPELPASRRDVAARTASGSFRIQLAAVPPGEEQVTFERLKRRLGDALAGLAPRFQAVSTDSGVLVRVQAAGFASADAASAQCARIRAAGGDCFVVAGSG